MARYLIGNIKGPRGPQGPAGPEGPAGTSFNVKGTYSTLAELELAHPTGTAGDVYFVGSDMYCWSVDDSE